MFEIYFKNYIIHWIPAVKNNNAGRASGGCLYGFKKSIQKQYNLKFCNLQNNIILNAKFGEELFYFIPRYLNCTNWKHDFEKFELFLSQLKPSNFCILGDLNARMSNYQVLDPYALVNLPHISENRNSKDLKLNLEGKKLLELIEEIGGIILNGRSADDINGEYTFMGGRGNTVIDYIICSHNFLYFVEHFSINPSIYSDHLPLCLKIKVPTSKPATNILQKLKWNPKFLHSYSSNLNEISKPIDIHDSTSVDCLVDSCVEKIKIANVSQYRKSFFEATQPWFDCRCARAQKQLKKYLSIYQSEYSDINKTNYLTAKESYKNICNIKKLEYLNNNIQQLKTVRSSKEWWKLSNSFRNQSNKNYCSLNSDEFFPHFCNLLSSGRESLTVHWSLPYVIDTILDSPIESWELRNVTNRLKDNKAPGEDGISYEFFKHAPAKFLDELLQVFNKIFLTETIPESFRKSILTPIFKKGDPTVPSNYRGLSLINTISKVFNTIILNRITFWVEAHAILNEFQAGFRKNYSTIDNIFNLTNIIEINKSQGKKTFAFFIDFSCAFDTIPHNCLFYKLSCLGLSTKMIRILQATYNNSNCRIFDGTSFSDPFPIEVGVKQGCILSPILFSLFLNDLVDNLPFGITVAGVNVKILLYADDIVVLADSVEDLQKMIDALYSYCTTWSLNLNLEKSKILIFRASNRSPSNINLKYGEQEIEIVNSYKYLGVELTFNLSFKKHLSNKLSTSKMAINSTWSKYINHPSISKTNKLTIFNAASKSIMLYAAQVWGFKEYEDVEKLFRFFIKKMLFLHKTTPNYVLHLETGLHSLYLETLNLHFNYIIKALNSMSSNRLPHILAKYVLENKLYWAKNWEILINKLQISNLNFCNPNEYCDIILHKLRIYENQQYIIKAQNSQHHDLYPKLDLNTSHLLLQNFNAWSTSLIIKARSGMLNLNARPFLTNNGTICSICNMNEVENTFHFIGICPIFSSIRIQFYGVNFLNESEVIRLLNGTDFYTLYKYIEICQNYRNLIINEY